MVNEHEGRRWAPIVFPARGRPKVPGHLRDRVATIYRAQAQDGRRFDAARSGLLARLDLTDTALTVMTCDAQFSSLLENWVAGCDAHGIECRRATLIFATDAQAHVRAEAMGLVSYHDAESSILGDMNPSTAYGDVQWVDYMYHQNWVIKKCVELSVDVLFQDVDLVWRHDPVPWLRRQAARGADVQAMYDGPNFRFQPLYANTGFMYLAATARVRAFWADVYGRHDMVGYFRSQQEPLNVVLAAHAHRGLQVQILDEARFANGHLYCGGRSIPPDPWVVHHSWTGTFQDKLDRYRVNDHWFLPQTEA